MSLCGFDFVAGDEGLRAIFKKRKIIDDKVSLENDFSEMKSALIKHELKFQRYSKLPFSLLKTPKHIFTTVRKKYRLQKTLTLAKAIED